MSFLIKFYNFIFFIFGLIALMDNKYGLFNIFVYLNY